MTTAATAPNRIFLLPPLDSASSVAPPKVNDGAEPTIAGELLGAASAGFSKSASAAACSCGFATTGASSILRAGAGALAAPLVASGEPAVKAGLGGAIAAGAGNCSGVGWMEFGSRAPSQALLQAPRCRVQELLRPSRRALNWRPRLRATQKVHLARTAESRPAGVRLPAEVQPVLPALRPKSV